MRDRLGKLLCQNQKLVDGLLSFFKDKDGDFGTVQNFGDRIVLDKFQFKQVQNRLKTVSENQRSIQIDLASFCSFMKSNLDQEKEQLKQVQQDQLRQIVRIGKVLNAYRERCRETYIDYLKNMDFEIRKVLKPLVPSEVMHEEVKYPQINLNTLLLTSLSQTQQSELQLEQDSESSNPADNNITKLNNHIDMLVNTLEKVAKELITLVKDANKRYFLEINPDQLPSMPPTPLAAPLPEYFLFDEDDSKAVIPKEEKVFDDAMRESLMSRIMLLSQYNVFSQSQIKKLSNRLQGLCKRNAQFDLQKLFKGLDFKQKYIEQIVYFFINPETCWQQDDIKELRNNLNPKISLQVKSQSEQHIKKVESESSFLEDKGIKARHRRFQPKHPEFNLNALETQKQSTLKKKGHLRVNQTPKVIENFLASRRSVPNNAKNDQQKALNKVKSMAKLQSSKNINEIRVRSITPVKVKEDGKNSPFVKHAKTPVSRRSRIKHRR